MQLSDDVLFLSVSGNMLNSTLVLSHEDKGIFVLFVHGFAGNKDENGLFTEAANKFAENGISSLRFDFSGHGKSTGDTRQLSLDQEVQDYRSAIEYLEKVYSPRELIVIGFSLGATVAIKARDKRVTRYIFWSPAFYPKTDMVPRYNRDPDIQSQIQQNGSFIKSGKNINKDILVDLYRFKLSRYINHIDKSIRIIHGTKDERINYKSSEKFIKYYSTKKNIDQCFVSGAGHSYKENASFRSMVYDRSVNWILSP